MSPGGANSDSAQQIVTPAATGNEPLPETHLTYRARMNYAIKTYQALRRGGLNARNWLRLECKSEGRAAPTTPPKTAGDNWVDVGSDAAVGIIADSPLEECRPGGKPKSWKRLPPKRCGSADVLGETAKETPNRLLNTQESYGDKILYARTAHEIDILTNSTSTGTRESYSRGWRHWLNSCKCQNLPERLNVQEE